MAGRHPVPRRAAACALAVALLALTPAPASAAGDREALAAARDRVERTSAELAAARTLADRAGPERREELRRLERRLAEEKAEAIRLEGGLEAAAAADGAEPEPALEPEPPAGAGPGAAVIVPGAREDATGMARGPDLAAERVPAVAGAGAAVAAHLDGYLASKASPLTGLGAVFVAASDAHGLDPRLLVAIAGAETGFGTYGPSQAILNPFGMGPGLVYGSWSEAIGAAADNLGGPIYLGDGRVTIAAIQERWAPDGAANDPAGLNDNWTRNVSTYYAELGGDPLAPVFRLAAPAPEASLADRAATAGARSAATRPTTPGLPYRVSAVPVPGGASGAGPAAAEAAAGALGAPVASGGDDPDEGLDAGGLVRWAYGLQGVAVPRRPAALARAGVAVPPRELRAGDVVLLAGADGAVAHAGLYLGGGQFVHAPPEGGAVMLSSLYEPAFAAAYAGARRY